MEGEIVLKIISLQKYFPVKSATLSPFNKVKYLRAVDGISFVMHRNEVLGLAGESGCGKTTTGNILAGLYRQSGGKVIYNGVDVSTIKGKEYQQWKKDFQMIFQDPFNSLNPSFTVFRNVIEPVRIHGLNETCSEVEMVSTVLDAVELRPAELFLKRFPHQLSGGQRQRVSLARCLITSPRFIVADEPVSMLDVSIRAAFLELLKSLQKKQELSVLYISHNLSEIRYIAKRMAVMHSGKIVEIGLTDKVIDNAKHPYTQKLLSAVPVIDPSVRRKRVSIENQRPDLVNPPPGCRYQLFCKYADETCHKKEPEMIEVEEGHETACHLYRAR